MKTLIVGDDLTGNNLLKAICESEGHHISEAFDGIEALDQLAKEKIDLVISDAHMPVMDGYTLISKIKENKNLSNVAFILYTATCTSRGNEELAHELGVDVYIRKTGSIKEIITAIRQFMNKTTPVDNQKITGSESTNYDTTHIL